MSGPPIPLQPPIALPKPHSASQPKQEVATVTTPPTTDVADSINSPTSNPLTVQFANDASQALSSNTQVNMNGGGGTEPVNTVNTINAGNPPPDNTTTDTPSTATTATTATRPIVTASSAFKVMTPPPPTIPVQILSQTTQQPPQSEASVTNVMVSDLPTSTQPVNIANPVDDVNTSTVSSVQSPATVPNPQSEHVNGVPSGSGSGQSVSTSPSPSKSEVVILKDGTSTEVVVLEDEGTESKVTTTNPSNPSNPVQTVNVVHAVNPNPGNAINLTTETTVNGTNAAVIPNTNSNADSCPNPNDTDSRQIRFKPRNQRNVVTASQRLLALHHKSIDDITESEIRQYLQDVPPEVLIDCVVDASMQEEEVFEELDRFALTDPTKIRIFIRGLNYDTTKESLAKAFERFGPVVDATVIYDKIAKRSKGYGFITFESSIEAAAACRLGTLEVDNRRTQISLATPQREKNGFDRDFRDQRRNHFREDVDHRTDFRRRSRSRSRSRDRDLTGFPRKIPVRGADLRRNGSFAPRGGRGRGHRGGHRGGYSGNTRGKGRGMGRGFVPPPGGAAPGNYMQPAARGRGRGQMPVVAGMNPYAGFYNGYDPAAYAAQQQQYNNMSNLYTQQYAGYNPYFATK